MKETCLKIGGSQYSICRTGRITEANDRITITRSELITLQLIAQGLSYKEIALERDLRPDYIRVQMARLRRSNGKIKTIPLMVSATELGLLKSLTIDKIKEQIRELKGGEGQKPLNVTAEYETISTKVNV